MLFLCVRSAPSRNRNAGAVAISERCFIFASQTYETHWLLHNSIRETRKEIHHFPVDCRRERFSYILYLTYRHPLDSSIPHWFNDLIMSKSEP